MHACVSPGRLWPKAQIHQCHQLDSYIFQEVLMTHRGTHQIPRNVSSNHCGIAEQINMTQSCCGQCAAWPILVS